MPDTVVTLRHDGDEAVDVFGTRVEPGSLVRCTRAQEVTLCRQYGEALTRVWPDVQEAPRFQAGLQVPVAGDIHIGAPSDESPTLKAQDAGLVMGTFDAELINGSGDLVEPEPPPEEEKPKPKRRRSSRSRSARSASKGEA